MKELFKKYGLKPSKKMGQNFLTNKSIAQKIVKSAEIGNEDFVLEVGPGLGILTKELAGTALKVLAVEKDKKLIALLKEELNNFKNIEIINADILKLLRTNAAQNLCPKNYKVAANLPFNIASAVIRGFLEAERQPETMSLIVQKEVAQRIVAKPGDMNMLALSVQFYAEAKITSYILRGAFYPPPKVDAAIIKLTPRNRLNLFQPELFFKIARAGFSHPRKQLAGNLSKGLKIERDKVESWLKNNGVEPSRRAETLSLSAWLSLAESTPPPI